MAFEPEDKRATERILFSRDDNITAQAFFPNKSDEAVMVFVLSLSENGLGLMINGEKTKKLKAGDPIQLKLIMTPRPLDTIDAAEVEIKTILWEKTMEYATLNCQFSRIADFHRKKIRQYVNSMLNEIGSRIYKKNFSFEYK